MNVNSAQKSTRLTRNILVAMLLGLLSGLSIKYLPISMTAREFMVNSVLGLGGEIFITILKMLVIPVVFVSLVCGSSQLDVKRIGRVGGKTLLLYLLTTALAITTALALASLFEIGLNLHLPTANTLELQNIPSMRQLILNLFPSNPFRALAQGEMIQIILFALLLGIAISLSGKSGKRILDFFNDLNHIVIKLVLMVLKLAPYGVFCLLSVLFAQQGLKLVIELLGYFLTVLLALMVHLFFTYGLMLHWIGRLNPIRFFKKMYGAMLFAFSVSSSNASIPVVLETVRNRLGVKNTIASFVIPLGATINMDGTAIMQGVATVFIAHAYHVNIGLVGYLTVVGMATLASIGTAGIPSVGLISLTMVLRQVGLPIEGVALIIGIDRLLDMVRTAVNVSGDAMVACLVANSEGQLDEHVYQSNHSL